MGQDGEPFMNGVVEAMNALDPETRRQVTYLNYEHAPYIELADGRAFRWHHGEQRWGEARRDVYDHYD